MRRNDIVKKIANELGLSIEDVRNVFNKSLSAIADSLVKDKRVEIIKFGTFYIKKNKPFLFTHMLTGKQKMVHTSYRIYFRACPAIKNRIRRLGEAENMNL